MFEAEKEELRVFASVMRCSFNEKVADKILVKIHNRSGHCPCIAEEDDDTLCPCLDFRTTKECHCTLFQKR